MRYSTVLAKLAFAISLLYSPASFAGPPETVSTDAPSQTVALHAALQAAVAKTDSGAYADAEALAKSVVANPFFKNLAAEDRHLAYYTPGKAELNADDAEAALPNLKLATEFPIAQEDDWSLRLSAAYENGDYDDSAGSLTIIARKWPQSLSDFKDSAIFKLGQQAFDTSDDSAISLLESLHAAKWRPSDKFRIPDELWVMLARVYLRKGDVAKAVSALNDVEDAGQMVTIHSELVFDAVVALNPAHFDVPLALADEVAASGQLWAAYPDSLEGIVSRVDVLIKANRAEDALPLLDAAIKRATPADGSPSPFADTDDELNWAYNDRARALHLLGRYDEELDAYKMGAHQKEIGKTNVSQVINLGGAFVSLRRPGDALQTIADFDPVAATSPYGRIALAETEACAYSQQNDSANLSKELDYMKAHSADGWLMLLDAFICADDRDDAAKLLIAQLQNPKTRSGAIYRLQDFILPQNATPFEKTCTSALLSIRDRPDVAAAISAVGRIGSYPLVPDY